MQLPLPLDTRGPATTPEQRREYSRLGLCQECGIRIDDEWLLVDFGWTCREHTPLPREDGS